jgi:hypothetical protein
MRRAIALTLLALMALTSVESAEGLVRDGEVHHESSATAAAHASDLSGEHGHEDVEPSSQPEEEGSAPQHGPDHQHGTGADHCTHAHGPAISIAGTSMHVAILRASDLPVIFKTPADHIRTPRHEPPRA